MVCSPFHEACQVQHRENAREDIELCPPAGGHVQGADAVSDNSECLGPRADGTHDRCAINVGRVAESRTPYAACG